MISCCIIVLRCHEKRQRESAGISATLMLGGKKAMRKCDCHIIKFEIIFGISYHLYLWFYDFCIYYDCTCWSCSYSCSTFCICDCIDICMLYSLEPFWEGRLRSVWDEIQLKAACLYDINLNKDFNCMETISSTLEYYLYCYSYLCYLYHLCYLCQSLPVFKNL